MLLKSILVGLVYFAFRLDFLGGTTHLSRPLVLGTLVGIVLGEPVKGVLIGASLEIAYMGVVSIGMAALPDYVTGSILGTAFAINSGASPAEALALGIPIATALMAIDPIFTTAELIIVHMLDKEAEKGNPRGFRAVYFIGGIISSAIRCVLIAMAFYFGSDLVVNLIASIPETVLTGMNIAIGIIPAVGFVMILRQTGNRKNIPLFFIGYFAVKLFGFSSVTVAVLAALGAWLVMMNQPKSEADPVTPGQEEGGFDEF